MKFKNKEFDDDLYDKLNINDHYANEIELYRFQYNLKRDRLLDIYITMRTYDGISTRVIIYNKKLETAILRYKFTNMPTLIETSYNTKYINLFIKDVLKGYIRQRIKRNIIYLKFKFGFNLAINDYIARTIMSPDN